MSEQGQDRLEASRLTPLAADRVFAVLTDPLGHVDIDSTGMLQDPDGGRVDAVGDTFVVHMDREALGDRPMGRYDVTVTITDFEPDRLIAWTVLGVVRPPIGHRYGYRLEPVDDGTLVTSFCDWSDADPYWRDKDIFPVVSQQALRASLGVLERVARRRG